MSSFFQLNFIGRRWRPWRKKKLEELYEVISSGCWVWRGSVHKASNLPIWKGYYYAHRALFEKHRGLLNGKRLRPTCSTELCVNPDHWEVQ